MLVASTSALNVSTNCIYNVQALMSLNAMEKIRHTFAISRYKIYMSCYLAYIQENHAIYLSFQKKWHGVFCNKGNTRAPVLLRRLAPQ